MTTPEVLEALRSGRVLSGLRNCHGIGVDSIVLRERKSDEEGMVRIFMTQFNHPWRSMWSGEFLSLAAHNHRQNISLELLYGEAINVTLSEREEAGTRLAEYEFQSGILGEMAVRQMRLADFDVKERPLQKGWPCFLWAREIHTVVVPCNHAAWIVREFKLSDRPTMAYNAADWKPSAVGLYQPMTIRELAKAAYSLWWAARQARCGGEHGITGAGV